MSTNRNEEPTSLNTNSDSNNASIAYRLLGATILTPIAGVFLSAALSLIAVTGAFGLSGIEIALGGFGMVAALGAITGGFTALFGLGLIFIAMGICYFVTDEQVKNFQDFFYEYHSLSLFVIFSCAMVPAAFTASVLMSQAFLPLLICLAIPSISLFAANHLVISFKNKDSKETIDIPFRA